MLMTLNYCIYITLQCHEQSGATARLETCLQDIRVWTAANNLVLNDSKTQVIHVRSKFVKIPKLSIGECDIEVTTAAKNLRVVIDGNLLTKDHVKNVLWSASFGIYKVGKLNQHLDRMSAER